METNICITNLIHFGPIDYVRYFVTKLVFIRIDAQRFRRREIFERKEVQKDTIRRKDVAEAYIQEYNSPVLFMGQALQTASRCETLPKLTSHSGHSEQARIMLEENVIYFNLVQRVIHIR